MLWKIGAGVLGVGTLGAMFFTTLAGAFTFSMMVSPTGGGSPQVVAAAELMAAHLGGPRAQDYGTDFPQQVVRYWASVCPLVNNNPASGCYSDWQPGQLQCVLFVTGAFALAGQLLPVAGNAVDFWGLYGRQAGWKEIPAAPTVAASQRGLPAPGDIVVWSDDPRFVGEPFGHMAIVLSVTPPGGAQDGSMTFAEANGPGAIVSQAIAPDRTVRTWQHYTVLGYIRSPLAAGTNISAQVARIFQLDPAQYASTAEFDTWAYSACSTAVLAELLNVYGGHYRIHDVLVVEATRKDITPQLGLVNDGSFADTAAQFGMQTSWGYALSLDQVIATANAGTPVAVSFPPSRYPGGHLLIVTGGNASFVFVVDSSAHDFTVLSRAQFLQWWGGFSAIVSPSWQATASHLPNSPYVAVAQADATAAGISPVLFVRQINQESGFNPYARSPAGAEGIAQFMPATAAGLGIDPWNPTQALQGAATLMASYDRTYGGDYAKALAAYNAGSATLAGAMSRCGGQWFACLPAETQTYITIILGAP